MWTSPKFDQVFEERFQLEIARTEILRITILTWAISAGILAGILNFVIFMEDEVFGELLLTLPFLLAAIVLLLCYEYISWRYVRSLIVNRRSIPRLYRIINLLIETSFPSLVLLYFLYKTDKYLLFFVSPVVLIYFLFIVLSTLHLDFWISVISGALAGVQYFIVSKLVIGMVPSTNRLSPFLSSLTLTASRTFIIFLCGIAAGFVALEVKRRMINTYKAVNERNRMRQVLGQQVSYALVDHIIDEKMEITSKRLFVCVMFVDIRNFTPFAEKSSPEEVMDFQNKLFGSAAEIINRYDGIINQFLEDGFMATFGAPISSDHDCSNALNAGKEVLAYVKKADEEGIIHPTRLGIGLHFGEAVTGNVGTETRKQYSIVGNVVIQAARIEQLNKELSSQFLISREVFDRVEFPEGELLGQMMLKGESKSLEIVKIC
ncbi:MAG: adenylate/guanylate cyclase domain-containing protein [Chitinophagales bacterium]